MNILSRLEPKYSTLIQAVVITVVLVLISFVYTTEKEAQHQATVTAMRN